jgi:hypothetical protein
VYIFDIEGTPYSTTELLVTVVDPNATLLSTKVVASDGSWKLRCISVARWSMSEGMLPLSDVTKSVKKETTTVAVAKYLACRWPFGRSSLLTIVTSDAETLIIELAAISRNARSAGASMSTADNPTSSRSVETENTYTEAVHSSAVLGAEEGETEGINVCTS